MLLIITRHEVCGILIRLPLDYSPVECTHVLVLALWPSLTTRIISISLSGILRVKGAEEYVAFRGLISVYSRLWQIQNEIGSPAGGNPKATIVIPAVHRHDRDQIKL